MCLVNTDGFSNACSLQTLLVHLYHSARPWEFSVAVPYIEVSNDVFINNVQHKIHAIYNNIRPIVVFVYLESLNFIADPLLNG